MQGLEEWKDIAGYEGWYQVSNMGRIKSVERSIVQVSPHGEMMKRCLKSHLLTPMDNGNCYKVVCLRKHQSRKNFYIHRLVAEAFIQHSDSKPVVNHLDYDRSNNTLQNLEWTTQLENTRYSIPRMHAFKPNAKRTSTGEKYITIKNGRYRLNIKCANVDRTYATLEEAIAERGVLLANKEYYSGY